MERIINVPMPKCATQNDFLSLKKEIAETFRMLAERIDNLCTVVADNAPTGPVVADYEPPPAITGPQEQALMKINGSADHVRTKFNCSIRDLSKAEASAMITELRSRKPITLREA